MEFLAYALFIIILAIPYLVVAAIAAVFCAGVAGLIAGIAKRQRFNVVMGLVLTLAGGAAGLTIKYWATTPPSGAHAFVLHRVVYQTYESLRLRHLAMRWLRDGTFGPLSKEQKGAATNPGGTPPR